MKHLADQIKFIDTKLLPIFGFKNIIDYSHVINITDTDNLKLDLDKLNKLIDEFRKVFHSKNFSLHKTKYKILTKSQAICLLKTCLEITSVPFDISLKKNKKYLRLILKNNVLDNYINTIKMAENGTFEVKNNSNNLENIEENNYCKENTIETSIFVSKEMLNQNIKKTHNFECYLNPKRLIMCNERLDNIFDKTIQIDLSSLCSRKILKSLNIKFISKKFKNQQIIQDEFIEHLVKNVKFALVIGGTIIWCGNINEINYIYDNILIPLCNLQYHNVVLEILNFSSIIHYIENLEIKLSGEYVDLYTELENRLSRSFIEQEICINDKYNLFRIMSGMGGMGYADFMPYDIFKKRINGRWQETTILPDDKLDEELNDLKMENMGGKKIIVNNVTGCEFDNKENIKKLSSSNIDKFFKSNDDINFICVKNIYKIANNDNENIKYHKVINKKTRTHVYKLSKNYTNHNNTLNFDTITKLKLVAPSLKIDENNEIKLEYFPSQRKFILTIENECDDEPITDDIIIETRECYVKSSNTKIFE